MSRVQSLAKVVATSTVIRAPDMVRWASVMVLAFAGFAFVLLAFGKNPFQAYADMLTSTVTSRYGFSEVLVKVIPLTMTALAVAIPARVGLINIGGEGQLYAGALVATWAALSFEALPAPVMVPVLLVMGFLGGGLWAAVAGFLRARGLLSEVISTLLMNYVAILLVSFFVFGPWREPASSNFPQTKEFVPAAQLSVFFGTRVHLGIVFAGLAVVTFALVLARTRYGFEMRAIGGNPEAARRAGIQIGAYIVAAMFVAGGVAGVAGMAETAGVFGRLRPGFSPYYGYTGLLISWLAGHHPVGIVLLAFLMAIITAGADALQIRHALPYAAIDVLLALILFAVLTRRQARGATA